MRKPHRNKRLNGHEIDKWEKAKERQVAEYALRKRDQWDTDEAIMGYEQIFGRRDFIGPRKAYIHGGAC